MIFDLTIFVDFIDTDTNSSIGYQIFHNFDTEIEYTEENNFVPFEEIKEDEIEALVEYLIENERVGGQITLQEWAENRFTEIYSQPVSKPFTFQLPSESVGIGTSSLS